MLEFREFLSELGGFELQGGFCVADVFEEAAERGLVSCARFGDPVVLVRPDLCYGGDGWPVTVQELVSGVVNVAAHLSCSRAHRITTRAFT